MMASYAPAGGFSIEVSVKRVTWLGGIEVWAAAETTGTKDPNKAMARRRRRPEERTRKYLWEQSVAL